MKPESRVVLAWPNMRPEIRFVLVWLGVFALLAACEFSFARNMAF
jgi:hypothetical protein